MRVISDVWIRPVSQDIILYTIGALVYMCVCGSVYANTLNCVLTRVRIMCVNVDGTTLDVNSGHKLKSPLVESYSD